MKFYTSAHKRTHYWKNSHIYHFVHLSNEGGMQWQMFHSCPTLTLQQFRTGSWGHSIQEELQGESREVKYNPANWDSAKYMEYPPHHCLIPYSKRRNEEKWQESIWSREVMLSPWRELEIEKIPNIWGIHAVHTPASKPNKLKFIWVRSPGCLAITILLNNHWLHPCCVGGCQPHYRTSLFGDRWYLD